MFSRFFSSSRSPETENESNQNRFCRHNREVFVVHLSLDQIQIEHIYWHREEVDIVQSDATCKSQDKEETTVSIGPKLE